jgi:hypothetical protein
LVARARLKCQRNRGLPLDLFPAGHRDCIESEGLVQNLIFLPFFFCLFRLAPPLFVCALAFQLALSFFDLLIVGLIPFCGLFLTEGLSVL